MNWLFDAISRTNHSPPGGTVIGNEARTRPAFERVLTNRTVSGRDHLVPNGEFSSGAGGLVFIREQRRHAGPVCCNGWFGLSARMWSAASQAHPVSAPCPSDKRRSPP